MALLTTEQRKTRFKYLGLGEYNRENILNELNVLIDHLSQYRDAISKADKDTLITLLEEGKKRKEEVDG